MLIALEENDLLQFVKDKDLFEPEDQEEKLQFKSVNVRIRKVRHNNLKLRKSYKNKIHKIYPGKTLHLRVKNPATQNQTLIKAQI